MVKNWGAWGSMAPPITVDIMVVLLGSHRLVPAARRGSLQNIPQPARQQGAHIAGDRKRLHSRNGSQYGFARSTRRCSHQAQSHPTATRSPHGRGADNDRLRQLRPHRPIKDGRVKVEGCAITYLPLYPEEIFFRAFRYQEFDVSELSFSSYIRTVAAGTSAYVGIPAFVSRLFRHSGIYVRTDAGIRTPADLQAASASGCPNTRSPRWCGCAA